MKRSLYFSIILLFSSVITIAQAPSVPFSCPGTQVIAYKIGTNCTAAPYRFYTVDLAGTQSITPFYTLTNPNKEVNGLGINSVDGFLYGIEYDRASAGPSCTFSNFHLVRYDAVGNKADLGILPAPPGGAIQSAMGCVSREGNFIYSGIDASFNRVIAQINLVTALHASTGTLTAVFKTLTNICAIASFADWAIHPDNQKLYSYGIYNNGGVSTGTVIEIDPATGIISCTGTPNTTEFLDVSRDNFGGTYFTPSGYLYGVNINTRKLYRIDVTTGALTNVSTMSGSGQIRADMGSCANGSLALAVHFRSTSLKTKNNQDLLAWEMEDVNDISHFIIETQQGNGFTTVATLTAKADQPGYTYLLSSATPTSYRVKAVLKDRSTVYSPLVFLQQKNTTSISLVKNPVTGGKAQLSFTGENRSLSYSIMNVAGMVVQKGQLTGDGIPVDALQQGLYFITIKDQPEILKMVKL